MEATWEANKPQASAATSARRWVHQQTAAWGLADDLVVTGQLVASELVTNAVTHARSAFAVALRWDGDVLRIEVFDRDTRVPTPVHADEHALGGRGLAVVQAVSDRWGTELQERDGIQGKVVWAELLSA